MSDSDLLNFALNLEYLEAEYYARAVTGQGLGAAAVGGRMVSFDNPLIAAFAQSVMRDEVAHVRFLQQALGSAAIPEPAIDFRAGFAGLGRAAGLSRRFDPFADQTSFLLGAFVFEDVGVTAYHGAAVLLQSKEILTSAAGIHATEAYHAGMIRSVLYRLGGRAVQAANAISGVRSRLGGGADEPVTDANGGPVIVPASVNAVGLSRTPSQVLGILYETNRPGVRGGGFFPRGVNGAIATT